MGYSPRDVAILIEVDKNEFINDFENNVQGIQDLQEHGKLLVDAKVREKIINVINSKDKQNSEIIDHLDTLPGLHPSIKDLIFDLIETSKLPNLKLIQKFDKIIQDAKIRELKRELFGL